MRWFDLFILCILLVSLGASLYLLWLNFPTSSQQFRTVNLSSSALFNISNSSQFYQNMRYSDRIISYNLDRNCSTEKTRQILSAFAELHNKTILSFVDAGNSTGEITALCSTNSSSMKTEYFVAGEGGPTQLINTSSYYVILHGEITLFNTDMCQQPKVALHEILHALGFQHDLNASSIMYPITNCNQDLDQFIINDINHIYIVNSAPDLAIQDLSANKTGPYVSFEITVSNIGLKDSKKAVLYVYADNKNIQKINLGLMPIGILKKLIMTNLRATINTNSLKFQVQEDSSDTEISYLNNQATLRLAS